MGSLRHVSAHVRHFQVLFIVPVNYTDQCKFSNFILETAIHQQQVLQKLYGHHGRKPNNDHISNKDNTKILTNTTSKEASSQI